jgi:hypothetical protein
MFRFNISKFNDFANLRITSFDFLPSNKDNKVIEHLYFNRAYIHLGNTSYFFLTNPESKSS